MGAWQDDARRRTLALVEDLDDAQLIGPYFATVNPIRWAIGHVAWFHETWALRHLRGRPPLHPRYDTLFDSFQVAHAQRWQLDLPDRTATLAYLAEVKAAEERALAQLPPDERATYFHRLAVYHEDMHAEAILYDRQTLGYPAPRLLAADAAPASAGGGPARVCGEPWPGDVEHPGKRGFLLGATPDQPFVFDNEKWAHPVDVAPFRIARAPVTNGEFAEFVEAAGYAREELWSIGGRRFLATTGARQPMRWARRPGGGWQRRAFDRLTPLAEHEPVAHVCWYEAEAYCAWAGRRLPSEAEWELAATAEPGPGGTVGDHKRRYPWGDDPPAPGRAQLDATRLGPLAVAALPAGDSAFGCRQLLGNLWEWTADAFYPYPGFVVDPYREYSAPWFGYHKVLRGGCWATRSRLIRSTWRNFFLPDRCDVFAGFRTCAR
ncbi:MAG: ergothioneine biosynthesis protein EgtB [Candidatus Lambdaproteobacteria bacterium]|nr:ergothioneine biosynthesis protein EgtB [Candidatus Lambdaproteobacteria bacterium]